MQTLKRTLIRHFLNSTNWYWQYNLLMSLMIILHVTYQKNKITNSYKYMYMYK